MNHLVSEKLIEASVINITWERVLLYIDVKIKFNEGSDKKKKLDFYAVNGKFMAKAKFKVTKLPNDVYRLKTNITNPGYNRCLPRGMYSIVVCQGDNEVAHAVTDTSIVSRMNEFSKSFLYGNRAKVYNVVFFVADGEDELPFVMYTMASSATGIGASSSLLNSPMNKPKTEFQKFILRRTKPLRKIINNLFSVKMFKRILKYFYKFNLLIYKNPTKTILFMSEQNSSISSNQKAVYDRMVARGLDKEFKILFSFRPAAAEKQSVFSWLKLIKKLAKSSMVILDDHAPVLDWLILRKYTEVVQIWHAGAGFKSSGYSRWGNTGCPSPFSCHRQYNFGIAGSKQIARFFSEVWGINDEQVLPTGMPRMDEYLDENYKKAKLEELYKSYPICNDKKVILFAPTYRGKNKKEAFYPYNLIDFDKLYNTCGDEYVVLFKMHPWVSEGVPIPEKYQDKFIDVGTYPNINDLFYFTDLLITDYSSNIFEYSLMRKPMLFFAYDEIQYSFSRGFHRDYELSAPGKIVHTFDELLSAIETKDFDYEKVDKYVTEHFDYIDSHASDRVIDWIILGNIPEDMKKAIQHNFNLVKKMAQLDFTPEGYDCDQNDEE